MDIERYNELKQQRDAINLQLKAGGRDVFTERAKSLFEAHPILEGFGWAQYTPYFNDGDECVFRARTAYPQLRFFAGVVVGLAPDEDDADADEDDDGFSRPWGREPAGARELAGCAVLNFLELFSDDELRDLFDNHVQIRVTRAGVDVESYEHE